MTARTSARAQCASTSSPRAYTPRIRSLLIWSRASRPRKHRASSICSSSGLTEACDDHQAIPTQLNTPHGAIRLPAYVPVTTFGEKYPLDDLVRPYLPRLAPAVMVSFHYAQQMKERPSLPLLIDSGGFASLFQNAKVSVVGGLGVLETSTRRRDRDAPPA